MPWVTSEDCQWQHWLGVPWDKARLPRKWHRCHAQSRKGVGGNFETWFCPCGGERYADINHWRHKNRRRTKTPRPPRTPRRVPDWFSFPWAAGVIAAGVLRIVTGPVWLGVATTAAGSFLLTTVTLRRINGKHRTPEADHRDPDPEPSTPPGTSGTSATAASPGTSLTYLPSSIMSFYAAAESTPPLALERVQEDQPILAWRAARVFVTRKGLQWAALNSEFGTFGVEADATCHRNSMCYSLFYSDTTHTAPGVACECGFYAVPSDTEAWHAANTVGLLVELTGTVIEHEHGYRASHQRVVEMRLPRCVWCGAPVDFARFSENGLLVDFGCARHTAVLGAGQVTVTRADLIGLSPVPVIDEDRPGPDERVP